MKKCTTCKEFKEEIEFHKCKKNKDGLQRTCKSCEKIYGQTHKKEKKAYLRNYCKTHKKERELNGKKYKKTKKGKEICNKNNKKYKKNNPEKIKAQRILNYAVVNGKIIRPKICSICKENYCIIEGHHEDYSEPLDVIWCCHQCHSNIHYKKRIIKELDFNWTLPENEIINEIINQLYL